MFQGFAVIPEEALKLLWESQGGVHAPTNSSVGRLQAMRQSGTSLA